MQKKYFLVPISIFLLVGCASSLSTSSQEVEATKEVNSTNPPADCPVTKNTNSFQAPEPFSATALWQGLFWFGTEHLWTTLNDDGVWAGLPHNPDGYTQKIMWWSSLYHLPDEPEPALVVIGKRLDGDAPPLNFDRATNAMADDIGEAMLTGVDFPTLGCWEITGQYKKTSLTFVVWVSSEE